MKLTLHTYSQAHGWQPTRVKEISYNFGITGYGTIEKEVEKFKASILLPKNYFITATVRSKMEATSSRHCKPCLWDKGVGVVGK